MNAIPSNSPHSKLPSDAPSPLGDPSLPVTILAIIVLFNKRPDESSALNSVLRSAANTSQSQLRLKVLICDNTPGGQIPGVLPENVEYHQSPGNHGLANVYNSALQMATAEGFDWLLTLDHDTTIPEHFLERISGIAASIAACSDIAAIVPEVSDHGVFISPNIVLIGRSRRLPEGFIGIPKGELAAINSATTWRVRSWREIGGFNPLFWLDYLDLWAFRRIHDAGNRIYVAGDLQVEHELALLDPDNRMTAVRFENYLGARCAFCDLHGNALDSVLLTAALAYKLLTQPMKTGESTNMRRLTWRHLRQRFLWSRGRRIEQWKSDMMKRAGSMAED